MQNSELRNQNSELPDTLDSGLLILDSELSEVRQKGT